MRFVTSLNPKNIEKCQRCVETWRPFAHEIVAVQTPGELQLLEQHFPSVQFVETSKVSPIFYAPQCPSLDAMLDHCPGLIINSDIEVYTTDEMFHHNFQDRPDKVLDCGVRWDYEGDHTNKTHNPYGIDAFKITSDLVSILSGTDFAIGQPGWDYHVILEAHKHGYYINCNRNPAIFYHEVHAVNWSPWKLTMAHALLERQHSMAQRDVTRRIQLLTHRVNHTRKRKRK